MDMILHFKNRFVFSKICSWYTLKLLIEAIPMFTYDICSFNI